MDPFNTNYVNGNINIDNQTNNYQYPERPPEPSIFIPFSRDADFIERETVLESVGKALAASDSRVALVGLGGVGKSQLAIEYAYRTHERSPKTWIFWIYASNIDRIKQSYHDIADRVKIKGRHHAQANIFKLVYDWLIDSRERWLLILDNADDAELLLSIPDDCDDQAKGSTAATKPILEYLPHCKYGSILVTTRNTEAALKLVERKRIVRIREMQNDEALLLLQKKLGNNYTNTELAHELGHMPLAITQAAAFILQRGLRYSVEQYLKDLRKSESNAIRLLSRDEGQHRRDREADNSILDTFQVTFRHIKKARPTAADLLSLMSLFDCQGISDTLLRHRPGSESQRDEEFEDDILALTNFSLISIIDDRKSLQMHAKVRLATRHWLKNNRAFEQWKQQFISNLCTAFPSTWNNVNMKTGQTLFAHVKLAAEQRPVSESSLKEWSTLLYHASGYASKVGNRNDAEQFIVKSAETRTAIYGQKGLPTLRSRSALGLIYRNTGRLEEAETLQLEMMRLARETHDIDSEIMLEFRHNLAGTYISQRRLKEAEKLIEGVLRIVKVECGIEHSSTLTCMRDLSLLCTKQGRLDEAEKLQLEVLKIQTDKLGIGHPDLLSGMEMLANIFWSQCRTAEAVALQKECVEGYRRFLGSNHPGYLRRLIRLADYEEQTAIART